MQLVCMRERMLEQQWSTIIKLLYGYIQDFFLIIHGHYNIIFWALTGDLGVVSWFTMKLHKRTMMCHQYNNIQQQHLSAKQIGFG